MFGLSAEHILVLGVIILLFGAKRLPELGNSFGKAIKNFKEGLQGVEEKPVRQVEASQEKPDKEKV